MSLFPEETRKQAETLLQHAREKGVKLVTAESCTGGLIAALLTEIPGSSDVFLGGHVTYANEAKVEWLGVTTLMNHGAVSEETARAMAEGAVRDAKRLSSSSVIAIAVTGIAGPGGGTPTKPVGTVHLAAASSNGETLHEKKLYSGTRAEVRWKTVEDALAQGDRLIHTGF